MSRILEDIVCMFCCIRAWLDCANKLAVLVLVVLVVECVCTGIWMPSGPLDWAMLSSRDVFASVLLVMPNNELSLACLLGATLFRFLGVEVNVSVWSSCSTCDILADNFWSSANINSSVRGLECWGCEFVLVITVVEVFPLTELPEGPVCIGLGCLLTTCWVSRALAAAVACFEVIFVAIAVV